MEIQTENGTYVEVTEAEKVAIDKKWDYLEALTKERIVIAKRMVRMTARKTTFLGGITKPLRQ